MCGGQYTVKLYGDDIQRGPYGCSACQKHTQLNANNQIYCQFYNGHWQANTLLYSSTSGYSETAPSAKMCSTTYSAAGYGSVRSLNTNARGPGNTYLVSAFRGPGRGFR